MNKLELVIFDMDGLMFDTERIAFTAWRNAASEYGYEITEDIFKETLGVNIVLTGEIFIKHFGESFPFDIIKKIRFKIAEDLINIDGVPVKSGLYELLDYLKTLNIKIAVATSTGRVRAMTLLKMAGIDMSFNYVICGDEIINSKPDPEIFLKVADKLSCSKDRCLVLEDSEAGIMAAHKAGMLPIMIPDMKQPREEVKRMTYKIFASLYDVKIFLENINKF